MIKTLIIHCRSRKYTRAAGSTDLQWSRRLVTSRRQTYSTVSDLLPHGDRLAARSATCYLMATACLSLLSDRLNQTCDSALDIESCMNPMKPPCFWPICQPQWRHMKICDRFLSAQNHAISQLKMLNVQLYHCVAIITSKNDDVYWWRVISNTNATAFRSVFSIQRKISWSTREDYYNTNTMCDRWKLQWANRVSARLREAPV